MDLQTLLEIEQPPILLGSADGAPGIGVVSSQDGQLIETLSLEPGEVPYAIDVLWPASASADGDSEGGDDAGDSPFAVVGTRTGTLIKRSLDSTTDAEVRIDVGAAVLALLALDDQHVVTGDTAGRVLLWDLANPAADPISLPGDSAPVVALARNPAGELTGLTRDGGLLTWRAEDAGEQQAPPPDQGDGVSLAALAGPAPSEPAGLTTLVSWPEVDAIAYGAGDGHVVFTEPEAGGVQRWPAHSGSARAIGTLHGRLLTLGFEDGTVRGWDAGGRQTDEWSLPAPMLSGCIQSNPPSVLLTGDQHTGLYSLEENKLIERGSTPIPAGRVALPIPANRWHRWRHQACERRARVIVQKLQAPPDERDEASTAQLHEQLNTLGYRHLFLLLAAADLEEQGHPELAIARYRDLAEILSNGPSAERALTRYLYLLETFCWPQVGQHVRDRLAASHGHGDQPVSEFDIRNYEAHQLLLNPGDDWQRWLEAAQQLGWPIHGRYVIGRSEPWTCRGTVTVDQIAEQYEAEREQDSELPASQMASLYEPSAGMPGSHERLIIPVSCVEGVGGLEIVYFTQHSSPGVVEIRRLMAIRVEAPSDDPLSHNERIRQWLSRAQPDALWPQLVEDAVYEATAAALNRNNRKPLDWGLTE